MKRACVLYRGQSLWVEVIGQGDTLRLPDGQIIDATSITWLPPVQPGATIFALGLNYADHNKELGFAESGPPLIFLKGPKSLVAHLGVTPRPIDANQMHPECELVAVIGRPAKAVLAADALNYVSGYTIANDYAIREYLENYYRPNLRVKNRDATTPLGPWIVDASDIADPHALDLRTYVNGVVVQFGTTADMVMGVAELVAYLSQTMTLMPGDMILTGTPQGVHFCAAGDD